MALIAVLAIGLSGCVRQSDADGAPEPGNEGVAETLPEEYQDGITAVYDPQYPPSYFVGDSGDVEGYVIELQEKVAEIIGVPVTTEEAKFEGIITGIQSSRYDISYFHATAERRDSLDFVGLHETGSSVLVAKGNPAGIDLNDICGATIGITQGGQQGIELLPKLQDDCEAAGSEPIEASAFSGPNEGSVAVQTGRIDGWLGDAPYNSYIVKENPEDFEQAETIDLSGVSGFAFRQDDPLADVFLQASQELMDGTGYEDVLTEWEMSGLMIDSPMANEEIDQFENSSD